MPTAQELRDYARQRAREAGIDPAEIDGIGDRESAGFQPNIRDSPRGAVGVMQLMPDTARDMGVQNIRDPYQNIDGGVRYYAQLRRQFGGDPVLAAAAYNAGPGAVQRHGGVPPFRETQDYVRGFPGPPQRRERGNRQPADTGLQSSDDIFGFDGGHQAQPTGNQAQSSDDIFGFDQPAQGNAAPAPGGGRPQPAGPQLVVTPPAAEAPAGGHSAGSRTPAGRQAPNSAGVQRLLDIVNGNTLAFQGLAAVAGARERAEPGAGARGSQPMPTTAHPRLRPFSVVDLPGQFAVNLATAAGDLGRDLARRATGRSPSPTRSSGPGIPRPVEPVAEGVAGFGTGAANTILSMAAQAASPAFARNEAESQVLRTLPALTVGTSEPQVARMVQGAEAARQAGGGQSASEGVQRLSDIVANGFRPTTGFGRFSQRAGSAAPFLVAGFPAVAPTIAGLALGEGTAAVADAAGASPERVEGLRGAAMAAGGGLVGLRNRFGTGQTAQSVDPSVDLRPQDAIAAGRYVERQLPNDPAPVVEATAPWGPRVPDPATVAAERGMTTAEMAGPRAQTAVAALARRDGETAGAMQDTLDARRAGRGDRLQGDVERATGTAPAEAQTTIDSVVRAGRDQARPLFEAATSSPAPVSSSRLTALSETPVVQQALRQAYTDLANNIEGPQAANVFRVTPEGVQILEPTMATWDRVYQTLSRMVERNPVTGRIVPDSQSPGNFNINRARQQLRTELGQLNPQWDKAMARSGEYLQLDSAYHDGGSMLFNTRITEAQFAQRVARLSEAELPAFRAGIANAVFDLVQNGRMRPGSFNAPRIRAKLASALGEERATELLQALSSEQSMIAFENRYAPQSGSITSEVRQAIAEQDGRPGMGSRALNAVGDVARYGIRGALTSWAFNALRSAGSRFGQRDGLSPEARDEAGRMLLSSETPAQLRARIRGAAGRLQGPRVLGAALPAAAATAGSRP